VGRSPLSSVSVQVGGGVVLFKIEEYEGEGFLWVAKVLTVRPAITRMR